MQDYIVVDIKFAFEFLTVENVKVNVFALCIERLF